MDPNSIYYRQVALLVRVLPWLEETPCFALKGGTAINLFVRDMPRLSIDIDLAYLPIEAREDSLRHIHAALLRLAKTLEQKIPGCSVQSVLLKGEGIAHKLLISQAGVQIKVEVTPVLRGTVYPPEVHSVMPSVENEFGFAEAQLVSLADLYGGKICAALDRQHPRDLFDAMLLLDNEGVCREVFNAFLVYLISHNRPMSELLAPHEIDIADAFTHHFDGMTRDPISLDALVKSRRRLISEVRNQFTKADKAFLLSVKRGEPDWSLIDLPRVRELPAVQWKLRNLAAMPADRHRDAIDRLERVLEGL
ncbi:MAG: nucleotidyl transferase AbiEii/AbiGii toxin family protein [Mariprofundus sp.]